MDSIQPCNATNRCWDDANFNNNLPDQCGGYTRTENKITVTLLSNGIRSMIDSLEGILFGDFDNTYDKEEMDEAYHIGDNKKVVTNEAKVNLLTHIMMSLDALEKSIDPIEKDNFETYKSSVVRDILSGDEKRFNQYREEDFDWKEDYENYIMDKTDLDEIFVRQMKYRAGIIK